MLLRQSPDTGATPKGIEHVTHWRIQRRREDATSGRGVLVLTSTGEPVELLESDNPTEEQVLEEFSRDGFVLIALGCSDDGDVLVRRPVELRDADEDEDDDDGAEESTVNIIEGVADLLRANAEATRANAESFKASMTAIAESTIAALCAVVEAGFGGGSGAPQMDREQMLLELGKRAIDSRFPGANGVHANGANGAAHHGGAANGAAASPTTPAAAAPERPKE